MKLTRFRLTGSSIVNVIGVVFIVYLLVLLAGTVKRNYDMDKQISTLKSEISLLQSQKDELNYDISYFNTDSFREEQARSNLNLQKPGENVVIIPQKSPSPTPTPAAEPTSHTSNKSNLQQWVDFLTGKS